MVGGYMGVHANYENSTTEDAWFFAQIQHCNYSLLTILGRALSCPRVMFLIVWPALLGFLAMMNGED